MLVAVEIVVALGLICVLVLVLVLVLAATYDRDTSVTVLAEKVMQREVQCWDDLDSEQPDHAEDDGAGAARASSDPSPRLHARSTTNQPVGSSL